MWSAGSMGAGRPWIFYSSELLPIASVTVQWILFDPFLIAKIFLLNSCQCQTSSYIASTNRIWLKKAVGLCHMSHLPKCRALADQGSKYSRVTLSGAMWAAMLMIDSTMQSLNYMPVNRTPGALFASWIALIETYTHIYYICMEICDFPTF